MARKRKKSDDELFSIDMSNVSRLGRRDKRSRKRYWQPRYNAFCKAGFTDAEATWAANKGLALRNDKVKIILDMRKKRIKEEIALYGLSRAEAIEKLSKDRQHMVQAAVERLKKKIDESNVYYELS